MRYFEVCSFSLRSFYISYLKSFCPDFSLSHSFISSIIYVSSTHGYLCHTLSYNAKQLYLFCFGFGHWERFRVGPVSFDTSSSLFSFVGFDFFFSVWILAYIFATWPKMAQVHLAYMQPSPCNWPFSKDSGSWFLLLNNGIKNGLVFLVSETPLIISFQNIAQ